jgi:hypothetical protein
MTGADFLRNAWRVLAGMDEEKPRQVPALESLQQSEWSPKFETLMRNRLVMGAFRYGLLGDPAKPRYDRVASIRRRLDKYVQTGNLEHLVDVANTALLEFVEGEHPNRHFHSIDDGEHTKKAVNYE